VADEGRRRVGGRAAGVVLVVAAVAASGVFLDRSVGPKSASAGTEPGAYSGAWFCPHGGGDGWKGWVAVTNPGPAPVGVRVTTFGKKGPAAGGSFSLPARTERLVEVPATDPADTAEVEYFGGWVGAGAILDTGGTTPRTTAERCAPASHRTWFLPDGTTTTGQAAWLVVMNPFAKDAEFSVTIRTEKRSVQPGPLTPSVLGAGRSVAIKLNDFALAGPGEKTITAEVVGKIGRVVAGSLEVGTDGVRSDAGIPAASKQWFLPVAGYPGPATLSIQDPGSRRVDLSVVDEGQDELKLASGVSGISVPAGGVLTYSAGVLPGAGVSVQAMNGVPFVLSGRVGGRNGDVATVAPVASSARRWSGTRDLSGLRRPGDPHPARHGPGPCRGAGDRDRAGRPHPVAGARVDHRAPRAGRAGSVAGRSERRSGVSAGRVDRRPRGGRWGLRCGGGVGPLGHGGDPRHRQALSTGPVLLVRPSDYHAPQAALPCRSPRSGGADRARPIPRTAYTSMVRVNQGKTGRTDYGPKDGDLPTPLLP